MLLIRETISILRMATCLFMVFRFCGAADPDVMSKVDMIKAVGSALSQKMKSMTKESHVQKIMDKMNGDEFTQRTQLLMARYTEPIALMKQEQYSSEEISEIISSVVWHLGTSSSLLSLPIDSLKEWKQTNVNEYSVTLNEKRPSRDSRLKALNKYKTILLQISAKIKVLVDKRPLKVDGLAKVTIEKWYQEIEFNGELNREEWIKNLTKRFVDDSINAAIEWQAKKSETYANNWLYGSKFTTVCASDSFPVMGSLEKIDDILIEETEKMIGNKRSNISGKDEKDVYVFSNPKVEFDSIIDSIIRRLIE